MKKYNKGFTLIELLIVIAVIGVLATIVMASLGSARERSVDKKFIASVNSLQKAAELAYAEFGSYPGRFDYYPGPPADETDIADMREQFAPFMDPDAFLESIPTKVNAFHFLNDYVTSGEPLSSETCPNQQDVAVGQSYAIVFTTPDTEEVLTDSWLVATQFGFHFYCVHSQ